MIENTRGYTVARSLLARKVVICGLLGSSLWSCSAQGPALESKLASATEIVDAIIVRHYDDGGTQLDVRGLFKGESVPSELRGVVHDDSGSGRMGEPARGFLEPGQRYVVFVYDHYFVDPTTVFAVREEDGALLCECPDGAMVRWMPLSEFVALLEPIPQPE